MNIQNKLSSINVQKSNQNEMDYIVLVGSDFEA
jgi:hypothetical protein